MTHSAALAQVLFQCYNAYIAFGVFARKLERRGRRTVLGTVVDDEHLKRALFREGGRGEVVDGGREHNRETLGLVIGRYYNG